MASTIASASPTRAISLSSDKGQLSKRLKAGWIVIRKDPLALTGVVITAIFVLAAIFATQLAPHDPLAQSLRATMQGPSWDHPLGTDNYGRDVLSRIIHGARVSILVGFVGVTIAVVVGGTLGLLAGMLGGIVETIIMRVMDIMLAFPSLLIALLIVAIFKPSILVVMIAVGLSSVPNMARLVRAEVLVAKEKDYVEAAQSIGLPSWKITIRHVLPNVVSPLIVAGAALLAGAILTEANLSFLGLGVPQDVPSWGGMINEGRTYLLSEPMLPMVPGIAIMILVLGINFFGDFLRDALDPRYRKV